MKLTKKLKKVRAHLPSRLPTSMYDFETFFQEITTLFNLPDENSYRHAVATMIMHLSSTCTHKPMAFFAKSIRKSQSNQVAYEVISFCRDKDKEKKELELLEKKPA